MFRDRTEVGKLLADRIAGMKFKNPIVLAIPRGGVPVAKEIAFSLGAKLDTRNHEEDRISRSGGVRHRSGYPRW